MARVLRLIGWWDGPEAPEGWPDVCSFVTVDRTVQPATAAYLRSGTPVVATAGVSMCRLCGAANGSVEQSDGVHFVWPEGLAHYVEEHGVRLPDEVADIAVRGVASAVDPERFASALESGDLVIEADWWRRQAGTGRSGTYLPGCRHSSTAASRHLPPRAEIYVDRVPRDDVRTLMGIRRLLGAAWPLPDLRRLLGSRPIHAGEGDPAELHRTLTAAPELRPYLFYATDGALTPIRSGTRPRHRGST